MIKRLVLPAGAAILAVLGAVGLMSGHHAPAFGLIGLALVGVGWLVLSGGRDDPPVQPLGTALATRSLVAAVCALAVGVRGADQGWVAVFGAAVLIGSLLAEPLLQPAARYAVPVVANLPSLPRPHPLPNLGLTVVLAGLAADAAGLLIAAAGGSAWWWSLIALTSTVPAALVVLIARTRRSQGTQLNERLRDAVAAFAPAFVVYTSRPDDASYQVAMWLPYLERSGLPFIIITRNGVPAEALAKLTSVPVVEARAVRTVDSLVVPSLRAAFYVNASSGNGAFVRNTGIEHVYLGHGDSDKPPSFNPTHAMYDKIFAAGPAAIRRYAAHGVHISAEKFRIVGRPQVENIRPAEVAISTVDPPVVLYAPTWRGHVEETMLYSLPWGEAIVTALLERGATVIFRPHPFSYDYPEDAELIRRIQQSLAADARASGRPHVFGAEAETTRSILDCINASDALVSDVSSVVSDYLFSGKPIAMVAVPAEPDAFVAQYPIARASYVIRADLANLGSVLEQLLKTDPMATQRAAVRSDYLGDFPAESYADAFVDAVRDVSRSHADGGVNEAESAETDADVADEPSLLRHRLRLVRRAAQQAGMPAVAALLALAALGSALAHGPAVVTAALIVITLAGVAVSTRAVLLAPHRVAGRGIAEAARAVLIVLLVLLAFAGGQDPGSIALVAAVLAGSLALEWSVQSGYAAAHAETRNFPELEADRLASPPALLTVGHLAALAAAFVLVRVGVPVWPLSVALAVVAAVALTRTPLTDRQAAQAAGRLREELTKYAPQFAVYFASTVGAGYQVGMWLPYFDRIGRPYVIVTRTVPMMLQIAEAARAAGVAPPIIYRPSLRSVEEVIVPSLKASFYVNNAARNTHFIERRELSHVWLNHGDSEKPACFNPVHAIYDLIFAAGQAGIDRYARHGVIMPPEKFVIVGRPQVEQIRPERGPIRTLTELTVLYAPTWEGVFADSRVYSLPVGRQIVAELLNRGARVIFRAHPFNYRYPPAQNLIAGIGALLDADRSATGRRHLWGAAAEQAMSVEDCFNASDAMISDVSAVVSDYLHSGKPFSIVSVGREPAELLADVPAANAAYVLRGDLSNLQAVCDDLLVADPLADLRRQTKIYYLGDFPDENYAEGFLSAARRVIDGCGFQN